MMVVLPKIVVSLVILGSLGLNDPKGCATCPKLKTGIVLPALTVVAFAAKMAGDFAVVIGAAEEEAKLETAFAAEGCAAVPAEMV